jgi:predicted CXXCH cytochrome family protein
MKTKCIGIVGAFLTLIVLRPATGARVKGSPHDLSALSNGDTCKFCHTPHGALPGTPGWSHKLSETVYKIYQSSSLDAKVGQPTGASKLCLSCHDGTVALTHTTKGLGRDVFITPGAANLGTDLSDDHPISFVYSDSLSAEDVQIRPPSTLPKELKLDRSNELQCTTCHDAHNNQFGHFLAMANQHSAMCTSCHDLIGWSNSSHESSPAGVLGSNDSYLQESEYGTVAENGCRSCHRPHSAGGHERLLHFSKSEDNCLNCHDGSVALTNLITDISKLSRHNVRRYQDIHDLKESPTVSERHIECVDCHNPHAVQDMEAQPPASPGALLGATGVTLSGGVIEQAQNEYEVCFKCHADNPNRVQSKITRKTTQSNTRLEFEGSGPSFHPVAVPGVNQNVPSLISPRTTATMIYCTDCHNSDGSGAKGPHGSNYSPLLAYRYQTSDFTQESPSAYELCYSCHSRNRILNDESFSKHSLHLEDKTPCSACHDAHGISSAQGTAANNSHLINFDITIVSSDSATGLLEFRDLGDFSGECFLECHGKKHSPLSY